MTVAARESPPRPTQKKVKLSSFYRALAKRPFLHGKAPVAALNAEKLAEQAENVESESKPDDDGDADYEDAAEEIPNDDAEFVEATTPLATPRSQASPKQKKKNTVVPKQAAKATGKERHRRSRELTRTSAPASGSDDVSSEASGDADFGVSSSPLESPLQLAQSSPAQTPPQMPPWTGASRSLNMASLLNATAGPSPSSAPQDVEETEDAGALNSDYEGSDAGSAEWFDDMVEPLVPTETPGYSESEIEPSDEDVRAATQPAATRAAQPSAATARKQERERWKSVIDNWHVIEGRDLTKLADDSAALKQMRVDGWETDTDKSPTHEEFPGLYDGEYGPTAEVLGFAVPLELFLFFMPREFWLGVEGESNWYYDQMLPDQMEVKFRAQTGDNRRRLEQIIANEKRMHTRFRAHEIQ
ncbi:hypothetical protein V7S43_010605 [Phytophthora oleae]|uniref:PiggyBac transposable element-derived protein domain-containing protein n=1 Tax=Phytophthora oleae TaxID=2107226 RepID=A0ABD3FBI2_9STRA